MPACRTSHLLCPRTSPHVCVAPNQICNGFKDCPDGSDEDNCVQQCPTKCKSLCSSALFWPHICHWLIALKLSCCFWFFLILNFSSSADFLCKDHRSCVPKSLVCDGRSHCYDGSDETSCPSVALHTDQIRGPRCRRVSRLCRDGTECVLFSHVCDGERDCRDGSDEDGCGEFLWRVWDYWRFKQGCYSLRWLLFMQMSLNLPLKPPQKNPLYPSTPPAPALQSCVQVLLFASVQPSSVMDGRTAQMDPTRATVPASCCRPPQRRHHGVSGAPNFVTMAKSAFCSVTCVMENETVWMDRMSSDAQKPANQVV